MLTASCPSGITCGITGATNNQYPSFSATLTVTAASNANPTNYPITLTATGGGVTKTTSTTITVTQATPFDFSVTHLGSATILAGNTAQIGITVALTGGTTQTVSLSYTGTPPSGSSVTLSPASGTPTFSSIFTMTTQSTTPAGTYQFAVTGTGGGKTRSTTAFYVTIQSPPTFDFSISVGGSNTVEQGKTATVSATISTISGSPQTVSVYYSGSCPAATSCSLNPGSGTPYFASTFTFQTSATTPLGTYSFTITGTGGGKTHTSTQFSITVKTSPPPPDVFDFSMTNSGNANINYPASQSTTVTVSTTLNAGSTTTATVYFSVNGCPVGLSCAMNPSSGSPPFTATLTLTTNQDVKAGQSTITVTGSGGGKQHSTTFYVTVTTTQFDFSISANSMNPSSIMQGQSGSAKIVVSPISGSGTVTLGILNTASCPLQATCTFTTSSGTPYFESTLTVTPSISTPVGIYSMIITGTGGGHLYQTSVSFTVTAITFDFILPLTSANPVTQGETTTATATATMIGSSSPQPIALSISNCPPSSTCNLSPASGTPTFQSTLTIVTSTLTPAGSYNVIVTGTGGGNTHQAQVVVQVTAIQTCNLSNPVILISFTDSQGTQTLNDPRGTYTVDPDFAVTAQPLQSACVLQDVQIVFIPWVDSYQSNPPRVPTQSMSKTGQSWSKTLHGDPGKYFFNAGVTTPSGTSWALSALKLDFTNSQGTVTWLLQAGGFNLLSLFMGLLTPIRIIGFILVLFGAVMVWPLRKPMP